MLWVERVTKRFGSIVALQAVDMRVEAGEVVALIGPNGAGKTTLFRCILGLLRFQGHIWVNGMDVWRHGPKVRRLIGYVPQSPAFHDGMTAGETLRYYARLRDAPEAHIEEAMATMSLESVLPRRVQELSGGMRQRLAVALALLGQPPLLLLDEPTANLDREGQEHLATLIRHLTERGAAVMVASHHLGLLLPLVTKVVALHEGKVVYQGPPQGLAEIGLSAQKGEDLAP